mmetsp:Transcript_33174/g.64149  ORF Transcript_33174/g.64149 Transcript_33174/m.64149 type:complete len:219 (-) Transcript_33174:325-981(-)
MMLGHAMRIDIPFPRLLGLVSWTILGCRANVQTALTDVARFDSVLPTDLADAHRHFHLGKFWDALFLKDVAIGGLVHVDLLRLGIPFQPVVVRLRRGLGFLRRHRLGHSFSFVAGSASRGTGRTQGQFASDVAAWRQRRLRRAGHGCAGRVDSSDGSRQPPRLSGDVHTARGLAEGRRIIGGSAGGLSPRQRSPRRVPERRRVRFCQLDGFGERIQPR